MALDILRSNLSGICAAFNPINKGNLIANRSGTHLYCDSRGIGVFWKGYYFVTGLFIGNGAKTANLKKALEKTDALFLQQFEVAKKQAISYASYITNKFSGLPTSERLCNTVRKGIMAWQHATSGFFKYKHFQSAQQKCLQLVPSLSFFDRKTDAFLKYEHIRNLEGICGGPLPLELIGKIAKQDKCTNQDLQEFSIWLSRITESSSLQKFFIALGKIIKDVDFAKLQIICSHGITDFFLKDDPEHLKWRNTLRPGSYVAGYTLSNRVGANFFEIQEEPDRLFMVSNNRFRIGMDQYLKKDEELAESLGYEGLPTPRMHFVDPHGKFAIIDKWSYDATNFPIQSEDTRYYVALIAEYVHTMIENQRMYSNLDPKYLLFKKIKDFHLASVRNSKKMDFVFPAVEKFLFKCSRGDINVFKKLMNWSKLDKTQHAKCFKNIIAETLKHRRKPDIEKMVNDFVFPSPRVLKAATKLVDKILKVNQVLSVGRIKEVIDSAGTYTFLWPTLEQEANLA